MAFHFEYVHQQTLTIRLLQIALEAEVTNTAAMKLYERLGFLRSKSLHRYYLSGLTAFRYLLYVNESAVTAHQPIYGGEDYLAQQSNELASI